MSYYYGPVSLLRRIKEAYGGDARPGAEGVRTPDAPPAPAERQPATR